MPIGGQFYVQSLFNSIVKITEQVFCIHFCFVTVMRSRITMSKGNKFFMDSDGCYQINFCASKDTVLKMKTQTGRW